MRLGEGVTAVGVNQGRQRHTVEEGIVDIEMDTVHVPIQPPYMELFCPFFLYGFCPAIPPGFVVGAEAGDIGQ